MSENFFKKLFETKKENDKLEEHDTTIEENQHEFNKRLEEKENNSLEKEVTPEN